jgi:3'(2'), 5'-bisphosphate nucleotidase
VIWVDPLDGTREFTEGRLEGVTVLIGVANNGNPIGGVIHQPFYKDSSNNGRSIWGLIHAGVHGHQLVNPQPPSGRIIAGSVSHRSKTVVDAVNACEPTEVLRAGGCGYKVSRIIRTKPMGIVSFRHCWCSNDVLMRTFTRHVAAVFGTLAHPKPSSLQPVVD